MCVDQSSPDTKFPKNCTGPAEESPPHSNEQLLRCGHHTHTHTHTHAHTVVYAWNKTSVRWLILIAHRTATKVCKNGSYGQRFKYTLYFWALWITHFKKPQFQIRLFPRTNGNFLSESGHRIVNPWDSTWIWRDSFYFDLWLHAHLCESRVWITHVLKISNSACGKFGPHTKQAASSFTGGKSARKLSEKRLTPPPQSIWATMSGHGKGDKGFGKGGAELHRKVSSSRLHPGYHETGDSSFGSPWWWGSYASCIKRLLTKSSNARSGKGHKRITSLLAVFLDSWVPLRSSVVDRSPKTNATRSQDFLEVHFRWYSLALSFPLLLLSLGLRNLLGDKIFFWFQKACRPLGEKKFVFFVPKTNGRRTRKNSSPTKCGRVFYRFHL